MDWWICIARSLPDAVPPPEVPQPGSGQSARVLTAAELESLERANLERALAECGGKVAGENGVARRLGLPPSTVSSRMRALGIRRPA